MSRVAVKMLGVVKEVVGFEEDIIDVPKGANVSTTLQVLIQKYGADFRDALLDPVTGTPVTTLILVNGVEIGNLQGLETSISDGDDLVLLSVTHGG